MDENVSVSNIEDHAPLHPVELPSRPIDIFLRSDYLARSLSPIERLECYLFNFHFLSRQFNRQSLVELQGPGLCLLNQESESEKYICSLSISRDLHYQNEGELSLTLLCKDVELYTIAFSFVPGSIVSLRARSVILISRMQGFKRSMDGIRTATKHFRDVSPQAVLFAVLQGLANALQIEYILGVSAREQVYYTSDDRIKFQQIYDDFFSSVGAQGPIHGLYYLGPNGLREFLAKLPVNHRSRTKAKRKMKQEISRAAEENAVRSLVAQEDSRRTQTAEISALRSPLRADKARWSPNISAPLVGRRDAAERVIPVAHLFSKVGTRATDNIVATGQEGFLVYGPYLALRAGRYSARFKLKTNAPTAFWVDVVAGDEIILAREDFRRELPVSRADIEFQTIADYYDVQFRVFVFLGASIQFSGVEIKRLDCPPLVTA